MCETMRDRLAPLCWITSGMYGPAKMKARKTPVVMSIAVPIARRVASSMIAIPTRPTTMSSVVGWPGRWASWL